MKSRNAENAFLKTYISRKSFRYFIVPNLSNYTQYGNVPGVFLLDFLLLGTAFYSRL
jgi:hypothetical protein